MMHSIRKSFNVRQALAALYFLSMATTLAANRIAERKLRDKQARRAQIISAARRIAELEGWSNVTVRRNSLLEGSGQIDVHAEHGMSTSLPATLNTTRCCTPTRRLRRYCLITCV